MLFIIGLGLEKDDISIRALSALKHSDIVLLDSYTSFVKEEYVKRLERLAAKHFIRVSRSDLEQDVKKTVKAALEKDVALLVPGDPLIATMHKIVVDEAKRQGIKVAVMHAPSVLNVAIGESGLSAYRFGPIVNVPFWQKDYKPTSFVRVVSKNLANDLHTLLLLDIDHDHNRPMSIAEFSEIFSNADKAEQTKIVKDTLKILVMADVGTEKQQVLFTRFSELNSLSETLAGRVLSIIVPASLSFSEEESLSLMH